MPRHARSHSRATALTALFDDSAALAAARRLDRQLDEGLRFYCEHREVLELKLAHARARIEEQRRTRSGSRDCDDSFDDNARQAALDPA